MDCGALILLATVVVMTWWGVWAVRRAIRQQKAVDARPGLLRALAQRLGFTFVEVDPEAGGSVTARTVFEAEFGPPASRLTGLVDGRRVEVLETVERRGARIARYQFRDCYLFEVPGAPWQRFVLRDESWAMDPEALDDAMKGCAQVELEDEAFEEAFTLCLYQGEDARWRFPPELRARLLAEQKAGRAFTVESLGQVVVLWKDEVDLTPDQVAARLGEARAFLSLLTPPAR